ncbi:MULTISPECIES: hypothetical protein [unclassified Streptococcus]|uniref:hypothetical protein n=1 Tax=unclassified Streptococcus TaxID=2608887 RepID=UPI001071B833|nr:MULTISPECIES: hypothetical protein [unclassified Streptococcus]MBF0787900.1 hypothetical protein [Streptococcus sp. 19428wC2_LYSM12]MCQ9212167.1 hypothetical protein [Streptococcus sp. B01]MCQ9213497.1 hypothetical protein [Streptococcus sp. O1]TFV05083.1 hypothetical protein E4T79_08430 [Streptococcus sp. LYSM12]
MAELKGTLFLGYSKASVHSVLDAQRREHESELNRQRGDYEKKIHDLEELNATLQQTIKRYQEKELFISEALTEAKRISRDILADSEVKAEELIRLTKENLSERVRDTEEKLQELDEARRRIVNHEEFMKVELRQLLNRHMEMIDHIELTDLHDRNSELNTILENSRKVLYLTKQIANESDKSVKNSSQIENDEGNKEDIEEIPLYSVGHQ